ncbi:MAK10-like protein [Tanacetum coccineum]
MSESTIDNYKEKQIIMEEEPNDEWDNQTSKDNIILGNYVKKCLSDSLIWYKMGYPLPHKLDAKEHPHTATCNCCKKWIKVPSDLKDFHEEIRQIHYFLNNNFKLLCSVSTSDRHLIELEDQVLRLMETHLAPNQFVQVKKIASSCEICGGPHDTQYCMENLEQSFVEYASSRTDKAGVLKVLAHVPMYEALLDKYIENIDLGKSRSAFIQGETPMKMRDPGLFILPCRLGDSKPFDTLADLGSCVNLIPLSLFKKLKIGLLKETKDVLRLADETKSYPIGIVKNVEVHVGKLKVCEDFHIADMEREPTCPLLVGRGFLATASAIIDCKKAKLAVGEGATRSIFGVKEIDFGEEHIAYWTNIGKHESYTPRTSADGIGARTLYYAKRDSLDEHLPEE